MWKQTVGDWQERRHRRSGPVSTTPHVYPPESTALAEHNARGFLPRGFHDRVPPSAYPASDGVETRPLASKQPHQTPARALTETWVTVTGASPDDVLDVRDFLDANVGRTVSHYLPPLTRVRSDTVYVQFASPLQAAQAVRTVTYTTRVECGVAALGIKPTIDAQAPLSRPHYYLEIVVSWCTDQIFVEERERLRRQLLESAAPSPQRPISTKTTGFHKSAERDTASMSLGSSARESEPLASSDAANTDSVDENDGGAAAHPLLPRHRMGQGGGSQLSPSPWSSRAGSASPRRASAPDDADSSPSPTSSSASQSAAMAASANPPVRDPAEYYRSGGAYRYEDSFFSDGLRSTNRNSRQSSTVLALFFHPCSSSCGVLYFLCLYTPLRFALLVLWTLGNAVGQLLPTAAAARRGPPSQQNTAPSPVLPRLSHWKQRRTLSASDVVPVSASPVEYLAFLLNKYVPFTPDPEEVDVVLWSWLALRSPYPQRSLHLLKQSLLVRQRHTEMMVGQLRPGCDGDSIGNTDVDQYARFGSVDVLGGEPYHHWERQQQADRHRELLVLLRWRPAWWFSRYSSLSLLVATVLVCCSFYRSLLE
ncbi:hypothetical protein ABB37_00233 [Leptomonas pyrrhocoris]|uniref:RRM domain-containing protein n=1 Tax=Leptomonas pyrrhocoris TaxID=157538 RepID=A0A0N0E017_LEPPY|nr:hypothetical protein ABB37_00233 [Leptomonas pyrrhocoris]XP_015664366.1 hypothetical protein ABB37_00233 [Leptomonas pyrrhocoris]XP_015664367.1 hypothetical protein ABB37_00233 [Leptomonas pyrrhocoris]KPA85926.1 hypothetical protein ABB37_00233 [Leptomonas pyrrhocoris]KPA85927.1 hypothetical protein ABB37_00233 [Leptomonas pyrrhocoris]KPA85928.1 hypothetical protein ABB37_00233 [Leptomonas pyrrhocoris]|eukprot:XP_015664365.1 hypothetical protein ABB37_00233 [Leptomonas pyrrhocoris]